MDHVELVRTVSTETGDARGHVRGTIACRSVWACPVCSAAIRRSRQEALREAGRRWEEQGGSIWLWTLTLRHQRGEKLVDLLGALFQSYRRTIKGNPWAKRMERFGIAHIVRSTEATWGEQAGWHPHFHLALFVRPGFDLLKPHKLGNGESEHFPTWLEDRWLSRLESVGRSAARGIGSDVRRISAEAVAYAIAPEEAKRAEKMALELTRADLKSAYGGRVTPFEMLDHPGEIQWELRFLEWEVSTAGRKCMSGVKTLCEAMGVSLATEEEATEQDVTESIEWVEQSTDQLQAEAWRRLCDGKLDHAAVVAYAVGGLSAVHALLGDSHLPHHDQPAGNDSQLTTRDVGTFTASALVQRRRHAMELEAAAVRLVRFQHGGPVCTTDRPPAGSSHPLTRQLVKGRLASVSSRPRRPPDSELS